jgi:hypothetical protein
MYARLLTQTSTRLLKLFPGEPNSQIVTSLEQVDLENSPFYECLSYTWGTSLDTSDIVVDDSTVAIRRNLYNFLLRLRDAKETRTLWVDALCISQTDLDEKAHQVAMIGRIFRQAARVLVWVGESADSSDMLFQPTAASPLWRKALGAQPSLEVIRQRVTIWNDFLSRPYWKRTWIVQEIICVKAIIVHCGADCASWENLIRPRIYAVGGLQFDGISLVSSNLKKAVGLQAASQFVENAQNIENLANSRWSYWQARDTAASGHQIVYLFPQFASNGSFDRRDKIYAMLSLEPEEAFRDAVGVDYKISVEELFARVLGAMEHRRWNGRLAASSLVRIFAMSRREVSELLTHLGTRTRAPSAESLSYLERYVHDGELSPFSDAPINPSS